MSLSDKEIFLKEVLSRIKFPFDRNDIREELECHIEDKTGCYLEQGYDRETAEKQSVSDMGDPKEIGTELNRQHNPVIGWIWKTTDLLLKVTAAITMFVIWVQFLNWLTGLYGENPERLIPESDMVYKIDLDEKVKIDDTVIHFTGAAYDKNGDMNIFFKYYDTRLWGTGWDYAPIGEISDNLGNTYSAFSGSQNGGIVSECLRTVKGFSKDADTLIISYDRYNRKYRLEIPLKAGGRYE